MQLSPRSLLILLAGLAVAGCSGGGLNPLPSGDITISDPITGAAIVTSFASPYPVSNLTFSIAVKESHFGGPYTVNVTNQTNQPTASNGGNVYPFSFNVPCFTSTQTVQSNSQTNVIIFSGTNANGMPGNFPVQPITPEQQTTGGNPCHSGEEETVAISDGHAHTAYFYYEELP
jgi:hypothetical protein